MWSASSWRCSYKWDSRAEPLWSDRGRGTGIDWSQSVVIFANFAAERVPEQASFNPDPVPVDLASISRKLSNSRFVWLWSLATESRGLQRVCMDALDVLLWLSSSCPAGVS